ncbi:hypothetical protein [Parasphingorhabdus sp.]|uniref:hypothetical protein n=1 Tax=Parasphingorhabdus sp. TaxID=2709688 RepID=UPI003A91EAB1
MDYSRRMKGLGLILMPWLWVPALALIGSCDSNSSLVAEAGRAEIDGRVISNELMAEMYPRSFRPGSPKYLERDFEAGADFICDEIKIEFQRDICSEPEVNWRP